MNKVHLSAYDNLLALMKKADEMTKNLLGYDVSTAQGIIDAHNELEKIVSDLKINTETQLSKKVTRDEEKCITMAMLAKEIIDAIEAAAKSGGSGGTGGGSTSGTIITDSKVDINTEDGTMEFGKDSYVVHDNKTTDVSNQSYDISGAVAEGGVIWYDTKNNKITNSANDNCVPIGSIWNGGMSPELNINNSSKVYVNGMPVTISPKWFGKRLVVLGDDYVLGTGANKPFQEWLYQLCGFDEIQSYGVNNSCITPKTEDIPTWENDFDSYVERYEDMNDWYVAAVIIFGTATDWRAGKDLGTIDDTDSETFCGAVRTLLSGIRSMYPDASIYFITSPQNDYVNRPASNLAGTDYKGNEKGYNRKGLRQIEYNDKVIELCGLFGIPCLDLYRNLIYGLSGVLGVLGVAEGIYGSDGLNGNDELHKLIALKVSNFMNNN